MTNEEKSKEIQTKDPCQVWIGGCPNVYVAAMEMAKWKDEYYKLLLMEKNMTIEEAINHAKEVAATKCDQCGKDHEQLATWLSELQRYKDKTPISEDFLIRNGFTKRVKDYLYCDDDIEIIANCFSAEMGIWYIYIGFLDHAVDCESLTICTVGQLRMFLAIEGLNEIVRQLK